MVSFTYRLPIAKVADLILLIGIATIVPGSAVAQPEGARTLYRTCISASTAQKPGP